MKKNTVAYVKGKEINELVVAVDEEKLNKYFDSIKNYDFTSGYCVPTSNLVDNNADEKIVGFEVVDTRTEHSENTLKTSEDVKWTLKAISEQGIVNFQPLTELLGSNSIMNNPSTIEKFREFVKLYSYEVKNKYASETFSSLHRMVMTFGNTTDVENFNAMQGSLRSNTQFLDSIGIINSKIKENNKVKVLNYLDNNI